MSAKQELDVDQYLIEVPSDAARATLSSIRAIIREELPNAEEVIRYGMPTYKQDGFVVSFAAYKNHCSLFPGHTIRSFAEDLKGYKLSKGTIQFPHDKPPPESLIREMVRARADENSKLQTRDQ
jgi:uncharacterized protein YdhG (YjbR/CyaY superfamily)